MNATILLHPLAVLLSLIHLGINICLFFLIIRWIQTWKEVGWLSGLDNLGRPLTGAMTTAVRNHLKRKFPKETFSERGLICICILGLSLIGFILSLLPSPSL
jgi:hypothetical protein